jgi:hypothetical protein
LPNLSQPRFAESFGLPAATLRDGKQTRRHPGRTAGPLLTVIARRPEAVIAAQAERGTAARRAAQRRSCGSAGLEVTMQSLSYRRNS